MAADALEVRIARLEGAYEQINERLGSLDGRVASLERKVDDGFAQVRAEARATRSELLGRMDRQFFWTLGLLLVSILMPIVLRLTRG